MVDSLEMTEDFVQCNGLDKLEYFRFDIGSILTLYAYSPGSREALSFELGLKFESLKAAYAWQRWNRSHDQCL